MQNDNVMRWHVVTMHHVITATTLILAPLPTRCHPPLALARH